MEQTPAEKSPCGQSEECPASVVSTAESVPVSDPSLEINSPASLSLERADVSVEDVVLQVSDLTFVLPPQKLVNDTEEAKAEESPETASPSRRRRQRTGGELPFLSLDPFDHGPDPSIRREKSDNGLPELTLFSARSILSEEDDILELTENEIVDLYGPGLDSGLSGILGDALKRWESAVQAKDNDGLTSVLTVLETQASKFGLHALTDLVHFMEEALQEKDYGLLEQLLPEIRAEVERQAKDYSGGTA